MMSFSGQGAYRGVHIGSVKGKIALWLDKQEAEAIAGLLGPSDRGADELYEAIEVAYPTRIESSGREDASTRRQP